MKLKMIRVTIVCITLGLIFGGCTYPLTGSGNTGVNEPLAWIDSPLNGSNLRPGVVEVVGHASATDNVAVVQILIDDVVMAEKPPDEIHDGLALVTFNWAANAAGEHLILLRAQGENELWGPYASVNVTIAGEPAGDTPQTPTETMPTTETPTATAAATTETPTATASQCTNRVEFVDETIPDNTVFSPGESFVKSWVLANSGTCTWDADYSLTFVNGSQMNGPSTSPLLQTVMPGEEVMISVNLQAPNNPGTYRGNWMLSDPDGELFGLGESGATAFWVQIVVEQDATITPTSVPDTQAPSVNVDYAPKGGGVPNEDQEVTFTANATDNVGVAKIEIFFTLVGADTSNMVGSCTATSSCVVTAGPFSSGTYILSAKAVDAAMNTGLTFPQNVIIFEVVK